jgi:hypothetical protein
MVYYKILDDNKIGIGSFGKDIDCLSKTLDLVAYALNIDISLFEDRDSSFIGNYYAYDDRKIMVESNETDFFGLKHSNKRIITICTVDTKERFDKIIKAFNNYSEKTKEIREKKIKANIAQKEAERNFGIDPKNMLNDWTNIVKKSLQK